MLSEGSDSWNVHITMGEPEVLSDSAGRYTSYTFNFQIGTEHLVFKARYSALWKFNEKVCNSYYGPQASVPKFPPKTWLSDMTKPKNYNKRAEELLYYFKELIKDAEFLKWPPFHELLGLAANNKLKAKMIEIAESMVAKRQIVNGNQPVGLGMQSNDSDCNWNPKPKNCASPPDPVGPSQGTDVATKQLDADLKAILSWAGDNFMSVYRSFFNGQDLLEFDVADQKHKLFLYKELLKGKSEVSPLKIEKEYANQEKPDIDDFIKEIDRLMENFEIDLTPEIKMS